MTNTDQGRAIRLLTSTITYSLEPTLGNVEYVGPFTDIFLAPGESKDYWFGGVASKPQTGGFTADARVCLDWEYASGFTPSHQPICSPTVTVSFADDQSICTLLFR